MKPLTPQIARDSLALIGCVAIGSVLFCSTVVGKKQGTGYKGIRALWKAASLPCPLAKPIVEGTSIFIGACDGNLYALRKSTGETDWVYPVSRKGQQDKFRASPLVYKDVVIAGTDSGCGKPADSYVYALKKKTGEVVWKLKASIASTSIVSLDGLPETEGTVVFGTSEGRWLSVEAGSGKIRWQLESPNTGLDCSVRASVATDGVNVCFQALTGIIQCVEAGSGRQLWKRNPDSVVTTSLFIYKDVLYFGTADHRIYGLDPANGRQLSILNVPQAPTGIFMWSYKDEKTNDEYIHGFATGGHNGPSSILTFDDEFEDVVWSHTSAEPWTSGEPELWKGNLIAGNCQGQIVAYSPSNGKSQWEIHVDGCISNFSHDSSTLYVTVKEGILYAYQLAGLSRNASN